MNLIITNNKEIDGIIILKSNQQPNLKDGDIILEVNREIITDSKFFVDLVDSIEKTGRNSLLLKILRGEESLWVTIQFIK